MNKNSQNSPIKGLLLYTFYSATATARLILGICLLFGVYLLCAIRFHALHAHSAPVFALMGIATFSCSFIMSEYKDVATKWSRVQLAMPIKRSDVIASKYLGHLLMLSLGIALTAIFIGLHFPLRDCVECFIENILWFVPASIGTSLISCGLFYPVAYVMGIDKDGALYLVCMFVSGGINALILWIGYTAKLPQIVNAAVCVIISAVLFVVSYVITAKIYAKKDF